MSKFNELLSSQIFIRKNIPSVTNFFPKDRFSSTFNNSSSNNSRKSSPKGYKDRANLSFEKIESICSACGNRDDRRGSYDDACLYCDKLSLWRPKK